MWKSLDVKASQINMPAYVLHTEWSRQQPLKRRKGVLVKYKKTFIQILSNLSLPLIQPAPVYLPRWKCTRYRERAEQSDVETFRVEMSLKCQIRGVFKHFKQRKRRNFNPGLCSYPCKTLLCNNFIPFNKKAVSPIFLFLVLILKWLIIS